MECPIVHAHTDASNHNNRDSIIRTDEMIDTALELQLCGVAITDHAVLSNHIKAIKHLKDLRAKAKGKEKERLNKFKLMLGCEIYLVNKDEIDIARESNQPTKFYHLVVIAKNKKGYRQLAKISSQGWDNSFYHRGMERTPVYKEDLTKYVNLGKGNLIATSACLGSEFAQLVLGFLEARKNHNTYKMKECTDKIESYLVYMKELFGDDYYIELQPSYMEDQIEYNKFALDVARYYGIKAVVSTDAHYHRPNMKKTHSDYLKSQNAERETEAFYSSTYLMTVEEMREYMQYMSEDDFCWMINNTKEISDKVEEYDLYEPTKVPDATIKFDAYRPSKFGCIKSLSLNFPYINQYLNSDHLIDKIILQQIEIGMAEKGQDYNKTNLERINKELESMWKVSEGLGERLSSYYVLTKEIVDLIWSVSLVGVSRGSAGAFYIAYLLGITQINPIDHNLPEWRHLDASKIELADIDLDSESAQRANILELVKEKYGRRKVLTIATFKTEGTASAIQTICRGMQIDINEAKYLSSIIPKEGMTVRSMKYCFDNYETDGKCKFFVDELQKVDAIHEGFIENVQRVEGLICGKSSHASGVYIFKEDFTEVNAMMKTPSGLMITQYDMLDSDYQSGLKLDFLTIEALDRIRKCMDLLLKDGEIEWQGSLRKTYDAYLHPDVLEMEDKKMFKMLRDGRVLDAFQYDSVAGAETISKIQPDNFQELMDGNALMRLNPKDVELPINVYVRHKNDLNLWIEDMKEHGLTEQEMDLLKEHLLKSYGVAPTQESIMRLSMDKNISDFDLVQANKLRKAVAKAYARHMADAVKNMMFEQGVANGVRPQFLAYVWEKFIVPQLKYSFSEPHIAGYTLILMQELNLVYKYPSLYWNVACLSVQAGNISEEISKGTDYGAIAKAIAGMTKGFVLPPDINKAQMEFIPLREMNKAMYSLNAINGIGEEVAKGIIANRPYNSFDDFVTKCVDTKIVTTSKVYNLIKAGAFDALEKDRQKLMIDFVVYSTDEKTKLTTANLPKVLEYGLLPKEYSLYSDLYLFRKEILHKNNITEHINKSTRLYKIPVRLADYFFSHMQKYFDDAMEIDLNGNICLNNTKLDKIYKEQMKPLTDWLTTEDAVGRFNNHLRSANWNKYCAGTKESWEIESICYYTDAHELDYIDLDKHYPVKNFYELPVTPEVVSTSKWRGREVNKYKINLIAGTVIDKNKNKSIVTLSTQFGVVDIKLDKGKFAFYDRNVDNEKTWFARGTKLVVAGYRRGETFYPKTYKDTIYQHSIMKLLGADEERVYLQMDREFGE